MMKRVLNIAASAIFVMSLASCAVEQEPTSGDNELRTVQQWVERNRPDMEMVVEGLYMKVHRQNPDAELKELDTSNGVDYTFKCQTLSGVYKLDDSGNRVSFDGNYSLNMYKGIAYDLGTFNYQTHYVPNRTTMFALASSGTLALAHAMPKMNVGDSVEIVGTSAFMYSGMALGGSKAPSGYSGNTQLSSGIPALISMKYNGFIENMETNERDEVIRYARGTMGIGEPDSIKDISLMYMKKLVTFPDADTISLDTTVKVYYTGRFIDGFVFDTNVVEVAKENNIYNSASEYAPFDVQYNSEDNIQGFKEAVKNMKVGEKAEVIFTSGLGYGSSGDQRSTWIQGYEPLVFTIEVIAPEEEEVVVE